MCFALMDEDGSGSIDASEMGGAFKLLNIKMHPRKIEELLAEVDPSGAGELDFLEVLRPARRAVQAAVAGAAQVCLVTSGTVRAPLCLTYAGLRRVEALCSLQGGRWRRQLLCRVMLVYGGARRRPRVRTWCARGAGPQLVEVVTYSGTERRYAHMVRMVRIWCKAAAAGAHARALQERSLWR